MPNWCQNNLVITKATDPQIKRIIDAVEREELLNEFLPQPIWGNTPNEDGVFPGPCYRRRIYNRELGQVRFHVDVSRFPDGSPDDRWYDWRCEHWGTKWEVSDLFISHNSDTICLDFLSAWSPPNENWIQALKAAMPNVDITLDFSEGGCDFIGQTTHIDGVMVTHEFSLYTLKVDWIRQSFSEDKLAIYENTEHEDYDEVWDELEELWLDVEDKVLEEAIKNNE